MTFRTDKISIILLLFLICFEFKIYAQYTQYSLPPKINYFLSEKEDFRKNEELRSDEYKREGQFKKALNEEQFFRDKAKDLKLTYKDKEYDRQHFHELNETLFIDIISNLNNKPPKTKVDSLTSIIWSSKNMTEILSEIYIRIDSMKDRYGGNDFFTKEDFSFILPKLNKFSDLNLKIIANCIVGNKLWQKTNDSEWFDYFIENSFTLVDSIFQEKDISEKIDACILIGDLCLEYGEKFYIHPREYLTYNPNGIKAYLKAYNIAFLNDLNGKVGFAEYKISDFYNPKWHNDILDKSLYHLNEAIAYYLKDDLYKSDLYSLMLVKRVNLECMKIFRDDSMAESEMVETISDLFNDSTLLKNESVEIKYYYYQALGYYFASTRLKDDLPVAKIYFEAALFCAIQNYKMREKIHPQIKLAISHLLWIYGNLNLEFEAINLYDLVFDYAECQDDFEYEQELEFLDLYIYYNLGDIDWALYRFALLADDPKVNFPSVYLSNIRSEIKYLITIETLRSGNVKEDNVNATINALNDFYNHINDKVFRELSYLISLEQLYQNKLLKDIKLKVEREKKNIRTYSIIAIIILCILGLVSAIIIGFTIWKIRRLKNLKFTSDKKAALSQVLARCMSHNIGSHALSKFMDKDVILAEEKPEQYLTKFPLSHQSNDNEKKDRYEGESKRKELIANFNEYLKYRMDFLADIATTSQPFMESPKYFCKDLFMGLDKNRILLNRISGVSSDVTYGFKIFINGVQITDYESTDKQVGIPNDVLGAQAFYIILENIIRNIYKHGNPKKREIIDDNEPHVSIEIHLDEYELDKSVYQVSVIDNLLKTKEQLEHIVSTRNHTFNEPILTGENKRLQNKLRNTNLGTIEMAACAAYLKGLSVDSCDDKKYNHKEFIPGNDYKANPEETIIYAYTHAADNSNEDKNYTLGYRFYINKPRQVLVVSGGQFVLEKETAELNSLGIKVVKPEELNSGFSSNHQFIYFDKGSDAKRLITADNRAMLPKRVVIYDRTIRTDTKENFIADLWKRHIQTIGKEYNAVKAKYLKDEYELKLTDSITSILKVYIDDHDQKWNELGKETLKEYNYYEMACSHSLVYRLIQNDMFVKNDLQFEYVESVLTKILVLDERIQSAIAFEPKKKYANRVCFHDYFRQQLIFIPSIEETNLNSDKMGNFNTESESEKLKQYVQTHIEQADFCIIHLGILERIVLSGSNKSTEEVEKVLTALFASPEQRKKVVITSGRGGAFNVEKDLSFIPLAMLENAILTLHDKMVLTKLLYNSRKCS
jgi:hypothetical protein